jgi:transposase InsO family protein
MWVKPAVRDEIVRTMSAYHSQTSLPVRQLLTWARLQPGKFYEWQQRIGCPNRHNGTIPKAHWLLPWEKDVIIDYAIEHETEGYRRMAYEMIDADVVYASPSSVYRVLKGAGLLSRYKAPESRKGTGYVQPIAPHEQWHTDISYVNVCGTFMYLITVLDGFSRYIVHHDLRASMERWDVITVVQQAREKFPDAQPRVISDHGSPYIAHEFKEYLRLAGLEQTLISVRYPESNGKMERFYKTIKGECIRRSSFLSISDARRIIAEFITHYNDKRLHSAVDYIAPLNILLGKREEIIKMRYEKLALARAKRSEYNTQFSTLNPTPVLSDSR